MGALQRFFDVVEGGVGFRMSETMSGSHEFEEGLGPSGKHTFEFRGEWGPDDLAAWLRPGAPSFMTHPIRGTVTAGGLCEDVPFEGKMELRYFSERSIRYAFEFEANGRRYSYLGEKVNILPWNLPVSHTTCFGVLKDAADGKLISRSTTFFRMSTLPGFLFSFRLTRGLP